MAVGTSLHGNSAGHELEKAELQRVISSKQFVRSPGLIHFLTYVCKHYFEGSTEQVKEYNIAVEAFGRPPSFQQRADPIVRVEANRLRKRLKEYYETEGKDDPIQITIPSGQYLPVFIHSESAGAAENSKSIETAAQPSTSPFSRFSRASNLISKKVGLGIAIILFLMAMIWTGKWIFPFKSNPQTGNASPALSLSKNNSRSNLVIPAFPLAETRILAGSSLQTYVNHLGEVWSGDRFFRGGTAVHYPDAIIEQTRDPEIFRSARQGTFFYDVPLKPGLYELRLYFSENEFGPYKNAGGGEGSRKMFVMANGKFLTDNFDVYSDVGGANIADIKIFGDIAPEEGVLHLVFSGKPGLTASLNGIEIIPGERGKMRPYRMTPRDSAFTSKNNLIWTPDQFCRGGRHADPSPLTVTGTPDPELYQEHRYGHFTYQIPVAQGSYTIALHFAETFYGPAGPSGRGEDMRVFDVYCNGQVLLKNFDIFKEAGGQNIALDKVFHKIRPNAQDKIVLSFVPIHDYACISALEVLSE